MPVLIGEQVKLFLSFASAIVVLWAFLRWVIRMQPKQQVFDVLKESKADYDELLFEALDRNARNRDTFRNYTERVFSDIIAENVKTRDLTEANRDRLVYIEEVQKQTAAAFDKAVARAMEAAAESSSRIARVLETMQTQLQQHGDVITRLDERMRAWDGQERRKSPRP